MALLAFEHSAPAALPRLVRLDDGGEALIRALRPDDERLYPDFAAEITPEDHRLRFFSATGGLAPGRVRRLTRYDPRQARAFIATDPHAGRRMLGVGRIHRTAAGSGEFAVLVRSDLKGLGLGRHLMDAVLEGADALGLDEVWGLVLRENAAMLQLASELGFRTEGVPGEPSLVKASRRSAGQGSAPVG